MRTNLNQRFLSSNLWVSTQSKVFQCSKSLQLSSLSSTSMILFSNEFWLLALVSCCKYLMLIQYKPKKMLKRWNDIKMMKRYQKSCGEYKELRLFFKKTSVTSWVSKKDTQRGNNWKVAEQTLFYFVYFMPFF